MPKPAYFTICSANYLAYALTLADSLHEADPKARFFVFLADRGTPPLHVPAERATIVPLERIGIAGIADMAFRYSVLEFNTAVKPFCFEYLLAQAGIEAAVYLDPDIFVTKPLAEVEAALAEGASCVLTPHITEGLKDGKSPDEDTFLTCGVFNLGFAAFSRSAEALAFLAWWGGKTRRDCVVAIERGIFTDQSYCNLAPCFIERLATIRNPGYNLAYWNLPQRSVEERGGELLANGEPVRFVHFSGIDMGDDTLFSKHQNRYLRADVGALKPLADHYAECLRRNDRHPGGRYSQIPYGFGRMNNGDAIVEPMRGAYRKAADDLAPEADPFDLEPSWFLRPDPAYQTAGPVDLLQSTYWEMRADLGAAFNIRTAPGYWAYMAWLGQNFVHDTGIGAAYHHVPVEPLAAARAAASAERDERTRRDALLELATTSTAFMLRNLVRRQLMGKRRLRDYWFRRVHQPPVDASAQLTLPLISEDEHEAGPGTCGVDVFGYFNTESGVGQAARGMAGAMRAAGIPIRTTTLRAHAHFKNDVAFASQDDGGRHPFALICANADETVHLDHLVAPELLQGRHVIGQWNWELPVFPAAWAPAFAHVDEVWAPSRFVATAVGAATDKTVRIVPLVVEAARRDRAAARLALGLPADDFVFLTTFDLNSFAARKNPWGAIDAFRDAFPAARGEAVRLVVKFHGRPAKPDPRDELLRAAAADPRITVIDEVFSAERMADLRAACDVFVSLHRSEGFGLNIAEAMAAGKLAIATDFGGNEDFLNRRNGLPLPYTMAAVGHDEYPFGTGQWWADPIREAAVEAMRWAADHSCAAAKLGEAARADMAKSYSPAAVGAIIAAALAGRSLIPLLEAA